MFGNRYYGRFYGDRYFDNGSDGGAPPPSPPVTLTDATSFPRPLFAWRGGDGALAAQTGEVGTFARAGNGTAVDVLGVTRTLVHSQPRFEAVDLDGDSVRESTVLLLGGASAAEILSYPFFGLPAVVGTVYVAFVERGGIGVSNATVLALSDAPHNAPSMRLYRHASGVYAAEHRVTAGSLVTVVADSAPSVNQLVELRALLYDDGSLQLGQSINGGGEVVSARSTALTKAGAWSGATLWVGSVNGVFEGQAGFRAVKVAAGQRSLDDMRRVYPA